MAFIDEERPRKPAHEIGQDITLVSEGELVDRIAMLKAEIERLEAAIAARRASKAAADAVFKL